VSNAPMTPRQVLGQEIANALRTGASGSDLTELVIRAGWQARPIPARNPNSDYLDGVLDSGKRVPIEIHYSRFQRRG
jgi:hypothetical protein